MKPCCPNKDCVLAPLPSPKRRLIVRNGSFFRSSDSRKISRFFCRNCGVYFSRSTLKVDRYQKRRRINRRLYLLLCSGVSQRRAAKILGVDRKTIVRRFRYLAKKARMNHLEWMDENYAHANLDLIQFDDLETAEHTKCKPLSVSLAVDPKTRKVLNFKVSKMPAKGLLARTSVKKYGYRKDERSVGWNEMMKEMIPYVSRQAIWCSDENPHYPRFLTKHHPLATHRRVKGGRGSVSGQGELKKLVFDPLFSLNHTCAMLRANMNRLFRRTWCITKNVQGLIDHLDLYVSFHNQELTPFSAGLGAS